MQTAMATKSAMSLRLQQTARPQAARLAAVRPMTTRIATRIAAEAAPESVGSGIEKQGPNMTALKDIQEIMDILPHRYVSRDIRSCT